MNSFLFALIVVFSIIKTNAQVGIGTTIPFGALDVTSTNDGLLIPRVVLTATTTVLPVLTGTESELVYNTNTLNDVTPGFYFLSTATGPWVRLANGATNSWLVSGNTGIVDGTNYLGTAAGTNVDVAFRRNNIAAGKIGTSNTSFGLGSLATNTTGLQGTAIGVNALATNQTGSDNTAIGFSALRSNTSTGTHTAIGSLSLDSNTGGIENTAIGYKALTLNTTGGNNVAVGQETLATNDSGIHNTAIGHQSLQFNKLSRQTAVGFQALQGIAGSAGADNTSIGYQSMQLATTGTGNSALGLHAGWFNSSGSNNVFLGQLAGSATTTGSNNIFIGNAAGSAEAGATSDKLYISNSATTATTSLIYGDFTSAPKILRTNSQFQIGDPATTGYVFPTARGTVNQYLVTNGSGVLSWTTAPAATNWSTTGNASIVDGTNYMGTDGATNVDVAFRRFNVAAGKIGATSTSFGVGALTSGASTNSTAFGNNALSVSTGNNNVAMGQNALQNCNTTAQYNTAVGTDALKGINSNAAQHNVAIGFTAMALGSGAATSQCVAIGSLALRSNTADQCTAVGYSAMINNTTGIDNVAVGKIALQNNTTGQQNTAIGAEALSANTANFNTGVGYRAGNAITTGANNTAIGYNAQVGVATNSNQIRIGDGNITLATTQIAWTTTSDKRLKSNIKNSKLGLDFITKLRPVSYIRNNDKDKKTEYGFIAQEIEEALNKAEDKNNGIISKDDAGMYAVRYNDFIPITVKAVQEQQALIEELQKANAELMKMNAAILKRLEKLEKK